MHRALSIPEVLRLILSLDISRETMRNAALTCSRWKDPALDQLWKELDSVFPLLWVLIPLELEAVGAQYEKRVWVSASVSTPVFE